MMRAETVASPLWVVSLVESALLCAVLALRVDVPTPPAIEIVPGEPPAPVADEQREAAIRCAAPARCGADWLEGRIQTLIDFQVLRGRHGHLGTDERYIVAEAMHELRSCRGGAQTRSRMPGGCTDQVGALLAGRLDRERHGQMSAWVIHPRGLVEMTALERERALVSLYMQCLPPP